MPMSYRGASAKPALALGLAAAAFAMLVALAGCSAQAQDQLPATHLDQANEVAASHERCGACHRGGTRGNGTYDALEYEGMESLPPASLSLERPLGDPAITMDRYPETVPEEGEAQ